MWNQFLVEMTQFDSWVIFVVKCKNIYKWFFVNAYEVDLFCIDKKSLYELQFWFNKNILCSFGVL